MNVRGVFLRFYLSEISRIDRELNIQHADIAVHRDRLDALRIRSRDQARIKREREKTAAIPEIKKRLSRRQAAAKKFDQLLKRTADRVAEFIAADEAIFERWAAVLPPASRLSGILGAITASLPLSYFTR